MTTFQDVCKRIQNNLFKIIVVGDAGVGKTSLTRQLALKQFYPTYKATIGVDFVLKKLLYQGQVLKFQIWDIAGQERAGSMSRVYYKDALGVFIVYDLTRPETFDSILKWKEDIDEKILLPDGNPLPCMILANKCDEIHRSGIITDPRRMKRFCDEHEIFGYMETSAKENIGIDEALERMADQLINKKDLYPYIVPSEIVENQLVKLAIEDLEQQKQQRRLKEQCNCK